MLEKPNIKDKVDAKDLVVTRGEINFDQAKLSHAVQGNALTLEDLIFRALSGQTMAIVGERAE